MTDAPGVLSSIGSFAEIEDSILGVSGARAETAHYDRMGRVYDLVCGTRAYNRLVWGTTPSRSRSFASHVFASRAAGPHVEVGCGGLLFTSHVYDEDRGRACILADPSIAMLRMARGRLTKRHGRVPPHVVLLRADGFHLPLPDGFATTVLSMHVLHVLEAREAFLRALARLAAPAGSTIGFTSLVHTGGFRDRLVSALHRAGELSSPMTASRVDALARRTLPGAVSAEQAGEMRFVVAG